MIAVKVSELGLGLSLDSGVLVVEGTHELTETETAWVLQNWSSLEEFAANKGSAFPPSGDGSVGPVRQERGRELQRQVRGEARMFSRGVLIDEIALSDPPTYIGKEPPGGAKPARFWFAPLSGSGWVDELGHRWTLPLPPDAPEMRPAKVGAVR